jgi:hypothetical protein
MVEVMECIEPTGQIGDEERRLARPLQNPFQDLDEATKQGFPI